MGRFHTSAILVIAAMVAVPCVQARGVSFERLEAIGDSLTINCQGGMVADYRTQTKGWVQLLVNQAGTTIRLPLLDEFTAIGSQKRQDYPNYHHCQSFAYNGVSTDDTFQKFSAGIPSYSFGMSYSGLELMLADRPVGYSMLQALKEDDPTFVVGFLGSNDFMERVMATGTMLEGLPLMGLAQEISPLDGGNMRPQDMFRSDFETVVSTLYKPGIGMCFGTLPLLPDIPGIMNKQELTAFVGANSLPDDCYTNYTVAACVRNGLKGTDAFADDRNYYTPAELQTINDAINGYNTTIRNAGANPAHPFCVVETPIQDPRTMTENYHVNGWRINNQIFTSNLGKPRATIMSTDGVHMTDIGNALCANCFIRAINGYYGTSIPEMNEAQLTNVLNNDTFCDNDGNGKIEGISCNVMFLTLNFVYPSETGDSGEVPRNAKILTATVYPPSSGQIGTSIEGPEYFEGTNVMVTAYPGAGTGALFSHWEGDFPGGNNAQNPLTMTMNAHKTLVAVFDTAAPTITGPADKRVSAGTCFFAAGDWRSEAFIFDDCSAPGNITVTQAPPPGTQMNTADSPYTVTITAEDEVGNKNQCTFTVTVVDDAAPAIAGPSDKSFLAEVGTCHTTAADWTGEAVVSDNCSTVGNITVTQTPPPGTELNTAGSPHTVTLTAEDEAGNKNQCTFTVTVTDGEAPSLSYPADKVLGTKAGTCRAMVQNWTGEANVSDNCSAPENVMVTQMPRPGSLLDVAGSPHSVKITAKDESGNVNQCIFMVTVVDSEAPHITCPADKSLGTNPGTCKATAQDWTGQAVVSDNCSTSANITVTQSPPPGTQLDIAGNPHIVTFTAEDGPGNKSQCSFTVTVADKEAPTIARPANKSLNTEAGTCHATAQDWTGEAVVSDNCSASGKITVTQAPSPGTQLDVVGSPHTITLTAVDEAANTSQCTFMVTVTDREAPTITCPANKSLGANAGTCHATAQDWTGQAVVSDNCSASGKITVTQAPPPGTELNTTGSPHTVTLTAKDEAGNLNHCALTVTVTDKEAPTITCPANKSLSADTGTCGATAQDWTGEAVVSDNCSASGNITVTQAPPVGTPLDVATSPHTITLTAVDEAANTSHCSFIVIVGNGAGSCDVTVPNLVGETQEAAGILLEGANLTTGAVTGECSSTVAAGLVISQYPAAGGQVAPGSAVALVVSTGVCTVTVPDVVGQSQAAADTALAGANLITGVVTRECSNTIATGLVISQNPVAGAQASFGGAVALVVSTGACNETVPDVVGLTQMAAGTALIGANLITGAITQECSNTVALGRVISQNPAAGVQASFGTVVALVVSSGMCNVAVPDVVGQTQEAAGTTLTGANLITGAVTQQCSNTVATGLVISQDPAAGGQASAGSAVALVVSTGMCNVTVPNVLGQTQAAADTALTGANLVTGAVTRQCNSTVAAGLVISQDPPAGGQASFGGAVALVVSAGVCNVTVPDVVGQTQADAGTALSGVNLVTGTVTQQCSNSVAAGLVISQNPA